MAYNELFAKENQIGQAVTETFISSQEVHNPSDILPFISNVFFIYNFFNNY